MSKPSKNPLMQLIAAQVALVTVLATTVSQASETIPPDSTETFASSVLTWQRPRWENEVTITTDDGQEIKFRPFSMKSIYQRIHPSSKDSFDGLWYSMNAPEFPPDPPDPPEPPDPPDPPDTPNCDTPNCCEQLIDNPIPIQLKLDVNDNKWRYFRWCDNKWQYSQRWVLNVQNSVQVRYYRGTSYSTRIWTDSKGQKYRIYESSPVYTWVTEQRLINMPSIAPPGIEDGDICLLYLHSNIYYAYRYYYAILDDIRQYNNFWRYNDGKEWYYYDWYLKIWLKGSPPKPIYRDYYWHYWWRYYGSWMEKLDPKFEIYAWFDRNNNGVADAGDVISGETTLAADITTESMRLPIRDIIGQIPAAPGLVQLGGEPDLITPTIPDEIEFIRYSEIDETSGELIVAPQGRGVMLRTAAGYSPLPPERQARAWPAGTPVRVRHLWELVHEGEFIIGDGEITTIPPEIAPGDFVAGDEITFETSKDSKVTAYNLLSGLDKDTIPLKAGRSYLIQLYIATERGDTNIFPATWIPLIGIDSFWPLPDGNSLPGLDTEQPDTRQIRHLRINAPPK